MVSRLRSGDPTQVGRYQVLSRIGGGGMGMVYLAEGPRGTVALKLVRPELGDDPHFRARFRREVQASFRVGGVCTVRLLDFDTEADQPWMATEYVNGPSLTELIEAGGPLPAQKQLALAVGLAEGLQSIHDEDVVHRDLKPSNVLCAETGPKVIDFGIAAAADAAPMTRSGLMVGSPGWLSPEQITTGRATAASDVFALGCILVYAASGEQPFGTGTAEALFYRVINHGPNIDFDRLAPSLHDLVRQATAQDPAQRPTARAVLDTLLDAGAVGGDIRGNTTSSVTSVLQRDWSLPTGLQVPRDESDPGLVTGAGAGQAPAGGTAAGAAAGGALDFSKGESPSGPTSAPPQGQPQFGQAQYGQAQYGQPQQGQPQYGQPQQGQPQYGQPPTAQPPAAPFAPAGPWTPPPTGGQPPFAAPGGPTGQAYGAGYGPSNPGYAPPGGGYTPPPQGGYPGSPAPMPPQGHGGFGGPSGPSSGGPGSPFGGPGQPTGPVGSGRRKPWLVPALVGGGVLALVAILIAVLVVSDGADPAGPVNTPVVATKDPNRVRSAAEVDALVRAAKLQTSDVPGYTQDDEDEPPGLLMPCDLEIQDFPENEGSRATGLDFKDDSSNYTDQRLWVGTELSAARAFFAQLKAQLGSCRDYKDTSGRTITVTNDTSWGLGEEAVYVDELKGSVHLSWGYVRQGTAVVLVSTITDADQKTTIGQQITRVADRVKAADNS